MIPAFPSFVPLSLTTKREISTYTKLFPPYSDYDFVSLMSWNIHDTTKLSHLNGNLVVLFSDYVSNEKFLSFIGDKNFNHTVNTLLQYAQVNNFLPQIKLVPSHSLSDQALQSDTWRIAEDRDNFDYLLEVTKIATMQGKKLHPKRRRLNLFHKSYASQVVIQTSASKKLNNQLKSFYEAWETKKPTSEQDFANEKKAFQNFLNYNHQFNTTYLLIYSKNELVGFTIFEQIDITHAVSAFQKANSTYKGIYEKLNYEMARYLFEKGCRYINIEQDLGKPGLRRAKLDYDPTFLKKYSISL